MRRRNAAYAAYRLTDHLNGTSAHQTPVPQVEKSKTYAYWPQGHITLEECSKKAHGRSISSSSQSHLDQCSYCASLIAELLAGQYHRSGFSHFQISSLRHRSHQLLSKFLCSLGLPLLLLWQSITLQWRSWFCQNRTARQAMRDGARASLLMFLAGLLFELAPKTIARQVSRHGWRGKDGDSPSTVSLNKGLLVFRTAQPDILGYLALNSSWSSLWRRLTRYPRMFRYGLVPGWGGSFLGAVKAWQTDHRGRLRRAPLQILVMSIVGHASYATARMAAMAHYREGRHVVVIDLRGGGLTEEADANSLLTGGRLDGADLATGLHFLMTECGGHASSVNIESVGYGAVAVLHALQHCGEQPVFGDVHLLSPLLHFERCVDYMTPQRWTAPGSIKERITSLVSDAASGRLWVWLLLQIVRSHQLPRFLAFQSAVRPAAPGQAPTNWTAVEAMRAAASLKIQEGIQRGWPPLEDASSSIDVQGLRAASRACQRLVIALDQGNPFLGRRAEENDSVIEEAGQCCGISRYSDSETQQPGAPSAFFLASNPSWWDQFNICHLPSG